MGERSVLLVSAPGLLGEDLMALIDAGALPSLRAAVDAGALGFVREAVDGNITQQIWTLATAAPRTRHQVPGPFAIMPGRCGIHAIGRGASALAPFWEVSARQGLASCAIAWPGTRNSDGANLLVVTDDIHVPLGADARMWPLLPGTINQRDAETVLRGLRVHPAQITSADTDFLVPPLAGTAVRRAASHALAAAATVQAVTLHVLARSTFRVIAVHFDFLERVRRLRSRAPSLVPSAALARAYRFFDAIVANVRRALPADMSLIVVSSPARSGPARIVPGVVIVNGPNVRPDCLAGDVRLSSVAPAALACAAAAVPENWSPEPWNAAWKTPAPFAICAAQTPVLSDASGWILEQMRRLDLRPPQLLAPRRRQIEQLEARLAG